MQTVFAEESTAADGAFLKDLAAFFRGKQVYFTIDLDGLDPSIMPAVGRPSPAVCRGSGCSKSARRSPRGRGRAGVRRGRTGPDPRAYRPGFSHGQADLQDHVVRAAPKMKPLKLKRGYHDATITAVRDGEPDEIAIDVALCSCCNQACESATLSFLGVTNLAEARNPFEQTRAANEGKGYVDRMVGILRTSPREYLLTLSTAREVRIHAAGLVET